ncbi:uncharacterized protein Nmag_1393 [Natrialba magadii ATCC 43099]|uniref:Uncharacterized protein n=1 Tax=Natrialba magadii (strain ATCC 43099 / DSM 3394 / CCM 3739 / CIP 104546 / IAM 13178 / JCM 8861 / NBRC 102185 / NCIMB 2190 / MS3) TaxID=547559 RepID=D3ST26_NATMM|nr:hypothetical protein [Natrialba magadii]ADD04972.1 uncharacterized protein Nmag_1393 [Natrialba magadii ATCC 43099]ELY24020.1 hypothetical protein C500_19490 [Natrialba magadii ATCC 43099]
MYRPVQFAGFLALLATPAVLLASVHAVPPALQSGTYSPLLGAYSLQLGTYSLQLGIGLVGAVAVVAERNRSFSPDSLESGTFDQTDATNALAVTAGAVVTYGASVFADLGPVLASALVGLLAGLALPRVAVPVYCGSFVGMASPSVFPGLEYVAVAGAIAGLAYVATTATFGGVGGKLGTIALFGCVAAVALTGLEYGSPSAPAWESLQFVVPVAVVSAVATVLLSLELELGPVVGSGLVGVGAGLGFPLVLPGELGATLAAVAFCASFVGMSSPERLPIGHVAAAGALCGLVYLAVTPALTGAGGKLGTIAFISCVALVGLDELSDAVGTRRR